MSRYSGTTRVLFLFLLAVHAFLVVVAQPAPTSEPTVSPVPTATCSPGTYVDEDGSCQRCARGKYQNSSKPPFVCTICELGKFNPALGSDRCYDCDAGEISSEDRRSCTDCGAGSYSNVTNCVSCEVGRYAPMALSGGCLECQTGMYAPTNGSVQCTRCDAGSYTSDVGSSSCAPCGIGSYVPSTGASSCMPCSPGYVAETEGSGLCVACPAGKHANATGASSCIDCPKATYSPSTGAANCAHCAGGWYTETVGQATCMMCEPGRYRIEDPRKQNCSVCPEGFYSKWGQWYCNGCAKGTYAARVGSSECRYCVDTVGPGYTTKGEGQASCNQALPHFYLNVESGEVKPCPQGTECKDEGTTLETLSVSSGYYRFDESSDKLYECMSPNCEGWSHQDRRRRRRRRRLAYDADESCGKGAYGPLCALCGIDGEKLYYMDSDTRKCMECAAEWSAPLLGLMVLSLSCCGLVLQRRRIRRWIDRNKDWLPTFSEKIIMLVVAMQIIHTLKVNHTSLGGCEMAQPYEGFVSLLKILDFDIVQVVPFSCFSGREFGHYDSVIGVTITPPVIFAVASLIVYVFAKDKSRAQTRFRSHFFRIMLVAYAAISRLVCQCFRCQTFDRGSEKEVVLLFADRSVDCYGSRYKIMAVYAAINCLIYSVGIPVLVLVRLSRWRHELNPPNFEDDGRAVRARLKNKKMLSEPVIGLALHFKPRYWWFEVFSLAKRFALTSLVLVFKGWKSCTLFTVIVVILFHVLERELAPLVDPYLSVFCHGLSWQILLSVIYMLFLDAEILEEEGEMSICTSLALLLFSLTLMAVIGRAAFAGIKEMQAKDKKLTLLHDQLILDKVEDRERFGEAWASLVEEGAPGDDKRLLEAVAELAKTTALSHHHSISRLSMSNADAPVKVKQPIPRQSHSLADIDALLAEANEIAPKFHEALRALVESNGGTYLQGPNKSRARAVEKIENDYHGDHTKLVDVVRSSGIFESFKQLTRAIEHLLATGTRKTHQQSTPRGLKNRKALGLHSSSNSLTTEVLVVRAKDRFNWPTDFGYQDLLLNVKLAGSEHVGELQLHIKKIVDIKPACHRTYALMRSCGWESHELDSDSDEGEDEDEECSDSDEEGADEETGGSMHIKAKEVEMTKHGRNSLADDDVESVHGIDTSHASMSDLFATTKNTPGEEQNPIWGASMPGTVVQEDGRALHVKFAQTTSVIGSLSRLDGDAAAEPPQHTI